ncbi:hypothetical protein [Paracoccus aestuariivivens]|uniref:Uncharacterized protein n=1 Tax=Paracoccus aestuariivivens TaxID=1820333 RepID=A0A6L6J6L4_9RHOB|nr:hypothetical protein [Paracoccus aestuariivivens]MTH76795.1 hypothetical protein [Paracoccus aestuariivivens]
MKAFALALAVALTPFAASAGEITLETPMNGMTLAGGETDMAVFFTPSKDAAYRVHAAYVAKDNQSEPKRLMMDLKDGDALSFSLPGHLTEIYHFSRSGNAVTISSEPAAARTGSAS